MSKVVLPFMSDESRTQGDSSIPVEYTVPYHEGMTVEELDRQVVTSLAKQWDPELINSSLKEMRDEVFGLDRNGNSVHVSGGFVIDEDRYRKIINSPTGCVGNDSSLYAIQHTLKSVIATFAEKVID